MPVSSKLDATPAIEPTDILTPKQLAARLRVPLSWVYKHTDKSRDEKHRLPVIRLDGFLRFDWASVSKWLRDRSNEQ